MENLGSFVSPYYEIENSLWILVTCTKFKYHGHTPSAKIRVFQLLDFISSGFRNWPPKMWVKRGKKDSIKNFKSLCAFHNGVESFIKEQRNFSSKNTCDFTRYFLRFFHNKMWPTDGDARTSCSIKIPNICSSLIS